MVVKEVSGYIRGRGSGEASTNSAPWGKAQREQPANVTVTKRRELCHSVSAGTETNGHLPGNGGGSSLA